jgi:ubiquinone/menaquinone biosynthesis C-methylase UbiE
VVTVEFNRLAVRPGDRILDMGCGPGRHTCAAYELDRVVAVGADINPKDLAEARDRLAYHRQLGAHSGGVCALTAADITGLPFADASFDLVICSEVLEHIPDHHRAMEELVRVLKPGKNMAVSVPRYLPERICWALSDEYFNANQGHVRIYRQQALVAMLRKKGLTPWALHFAHSLHSPYWWLKCLVGPTRDNVPAVRLYHRFLTWDIMEKPRLTRVLDRLLNPLMGKSLVIYLKKNNAA